MVAFATAVVERVISARPGLQRVQLDDGRAYVLTEVVGEVGPGDRVIVNTTAVDLGLGTGGWHVVHWNLDRSEHRVPGPGHIMKLRYTSEQIDAGSVEEATPGLDELAEPAPLRGLPVVVAGLHSMIAPIAAAIRVRHPEARVAYVMTDEAALPMALSDLVARLVDLDLLDETFSAGQAFGGRHECVTPISGLWHARRRLGCDVAIVAMGPGNVGTSTRLGTTALGQVGVCDLVARLGGVPIHALRWSDADERSRHAGLSHHSVTVLHLAGEQVVVPIDADRADDVRAALRAAGVDRHRLEVEESATAETLDLLDDRGLVVRSMGRPLRDDLGFASACAAAGAVAARHGRLAPDPGPAPGGHGV